MDTAHKSTTQIGTSGEDLACQFLKKQGYKILKRNFLIKGGEIDIIAMDKDVLVFIEVKTRYGREYGFAREAVTPWKLRYLMKAAMVYCLQTKWGDKPIRLDLVAIDYPSDDPYTNPEIELITNITV